MAAEQCSRYHMEGNSLVIRDVAEEDAGRYTVLVRIQEHGLFQNLTLRLVVNGEKLRFNSPPINPFLLCLQLPSVIKLCSCVCVCVCLCVCGFSHLAVSPQIGEKAVSLQDPGSVPRGSRQALHCTSHGVPPPHIQWLWHPCPSKGL